MALITAVKLCRFYHRGPYCVEAVNEVSITVGQGETLCILGRSGSGKTTLLNVLGLQDRPTAGELFFQGRSTAALSLSRLTALRRNFFGFIFQQPHLIPHLTALENVALPLRYCGVARKERMARAREMLERVGLGAREAFLFDELSGGQAQRVALARALVNRPAVLCADEPTSELDRATADEMLQLMAELQKETGAALVMVSHDSHVADHAARILTMDDGRICSS